MTEANRNIGDEYLLEANRALHLTLNFGLRRRALPSFNTASALQSLRSIGHSATRFVGSQVNRTLSNMKTHRFSGLFFDLYGTILVYGDMIMAWEEWFDSIRESMKEFGVKVEKDCLRTICTGFFSKPEPPIGWSQRVNAV